jgi:predicted deacetylase
MPTHVSIHDVSPAWSREFDAALALCHATQVRPALLVVPNFHGRAPLLDDTPFVERLRSLQADGHEVYLHGLYHVAPSRLPNPPPRSGGGAGRLRWFFAQRVASNGEAEMMGIAPEEGERRLDEGLRILRAAGLRVDGYVAPAWSMPRWLLPMLAARGIGYTEDHLRAYDPTSGRARASLVMNWASRSPARLLATVAFCRAAGLVRPLLPARIAVHPGDMLQLLLRREVERALQNAKGDFVARGADVLG